MRQDKTPPVIIIVCDNTQIAEYFFQRISGEKIVENVEENGNRRQRTRTAYGQGSLFHEMLSNSAGMKRTLRIDSKMLAEAESPDPNKTKKQAAEELRQVVATIGKPGKQGEQIRCVVSVAMLNEGWDANNVTQILGLRAFNSQLLCEQVVGRGLRRMNYTPDPETGLLTEEYVDVYGIPFSIIPFKGRPTNARVPDDKPVNHVRAVPGREAFEIRFPVVESYAFALRKNEIKADVDAMEGLRIETELNPTDVFVKPAVGYQIGTPTTSGPGELVHQNRDEFYKTTHLQEIKFWIAHLIVHKLVGARNTDPANPKLGFISRHRLFPQVFRLVDAYVEKKVDFGPCNRCELGLDKYKMRIVDRMMAAIEPNDAEGEMPLMPILNRYKPIGTSAAVDFFTTRTCHGTQRSQVNQVVLDTETWERSACFWLESSESVKCYVRNDHLGLRIPYEHQGITHIYEPDFIVRLVNGVNLLLEIKGYERDLERAKYAGAKRWVSAVKNWNRAKLGDAEQRGPWAFHVCRNPQRLLHELADIWDRTTRTR